MLGAIEWLSVGGYATMGVAAVVLLIALVGDRSRGKRRCRKCWYDMSAAPRASSAAPVICPECGKRAVSEIELLRSRRPWTRVVIAGLAVLVGWYGTIVALRRSAVGSPMIPTTLLVCFAPIESSRRHDLLFDSLVDRVGTPPRAGGAWDWQHAILARRLPEPAEDAFNRAIVTRPRWPEGSTPLFELDPSVFERSSLNFAFVRAEAIEGGVTPFDLRIDAEHPRLWRTLPVGDHERYGIGKALAPGHYALAFRVTHSWKHGPERVGICRVEFDVAPVGEVVVPACDDAEMLAAVRAGLWWRLATGAEGNWTRFQWRFDATTMNDVAWKKYPRFGPRPVAAVAIEMFDGDRLLHSSTEVFQLFRVEYPLPEPVEDCDDLFELVDPENDAWTFKLKPGVLERLRVRVRSSEAIAARSLGAPCHWSGQFEAPLTDFVRDDY